MACPFLSACLGLFEWTGCPGADADVTTTTPTTATPTTNPPTTTVRTQATGLSAQANAGGHAISLSLQNVHVATLIKLLGWTGQPVPCALRVSDQSGRI